MKVLVACEFSGVVRNAFLNQGHDAYSCDIFPSFRPDYDRHYRQDVRPLLKNRWDLVIAHPPCTYICNSGVRWLKNNPWRYEKLVEACVFFLECLTANSRRICVENPIPHREALKFIGDKYSQIIHPWQFGHWEKKSTCLWLYRLPKLIPTDIREPCKQSCHTMTPSIHRGRLRSITYNGIARAMAQQWGCL